MGNFLVWVIWLLAAGACVATGLRVITAANPFSSALSLIGNLASLAVLFLLASGEFVAAAQILVYAGAVMVMFLFVIAYLGGRADAPWAGGTRLIQTASVIAAASLLAVVFVALMLNAGDRLSDEASITAAFGSPAEVGRVFLTDHLLAFEITSIVLLIAAANVAAISSISRTKRQAFRALPARAASDRAPSPGWERSHSARKAPSTPSCMARARTARRRALEDLDASEHAVLAVRA